VTPQRLLHWSKPLGLGVSVQVTVQCPNPQARSIPDGVIAQTSEPFAQGLQDLGWVEGQNVKFEPRSSTGKDEMLPRLAAELVSLQPDVILAIGTPAARAAKTASQTIPIVFTRSGDPIGLGLVPSLARPSGNLTGLSIQNFELDAKRLELLINAVPHIERVGALWDPNFPPAEPRTATSQPTSAAPTRSARRSSVQGRLSRSTSPSELALAR
jgi:ABC-type uncharacterized transport system substrate-binding protein